MVRSSVVLVTLTLLLTSCGYARSEAVPINGEDALAEVGPGSGVESAEEPVEENGPPPTALPASIEIASKGAPEAIVAAGTFPDGSTFEITFEELDGIVQPTLDSVQYATLTQVPETFDSEVLRQIIVGEAFDSELIARNLTVSETQLEAAQNLLVTDIAAALANGSSDPEADRTEESIELIENVPFLTLLQKVAASETVLVESLQETTMPSEVPCVSHIFLEDGTAATEVSNEIKAGADFAELATERSLDTESGANGGALGCVDLTGYPQPFIDAADTAVLNEVSEPVQSEFGWHIILVTDRAPEQIEPLALAQRELETILNSRLGEGDFTVDPKLGTWDSEQITLVPPGG